MIDPGGIFDGRCHMLASSDTSTSTSSGITKTHDCSLRAREIVLERMNEKKRRDRVNRQRLL